MKKEVANRGNITKMFIAYVCHATMHTNCLISHILIPHFLWVFDLLVLAQFLCELLFKLEQKLSVQ